MMVEVRARAVAGAFELDVELEAKPGVTILFGPTASGKTLTLRLIAGLVRPASGVVRPFGDTLPHERGIGYAPQHGALWPHRTVLEHLTALGTKDRAAEVLARVGIDKLADRRPLGLSGGERQRLAFARALVRSPAVLMLDEPFSALHDDARKAMGDIVREEAARGAVVLLVTHDREEAERVGDTFVTYRDGKARQGRPTT